MRALSLLAVFSVLFISACQQENISGIYSTSHKSGIYAGHDGTCEPPLEKEDGSGRCYESFDITDRLGLLELDNGDLQFAASLWFFNAHSCTINGIAKKDDTGWLYESHYDHDMNCSLRINKDKNNITFAVDEDALCRYYCGMRGDLDEAVFPLSSKTKSSVIEEDINCITSNSERCRKQAEASE